MRRAAPAKLFETPSHNRAGRRLRCAHAAPLRALRLGRYPDVRRGPARYPDGRFAGDPRPRRCRRNPGGARREVSPRGRHQRLGVQPHDGRAGPRPRRARALLLVAVLLPRPRRQEGRARVLGRGHRAARRAPRRDRDGRRPPRRRRAVAAPRRSAIHLVQLEGSCDAGRRRGANHPLAGELATLLL